MQIVWLKYKLSQLQKNCSCFIDKIEENLVKDAISIYTENIVKDAISIYTDQISNVQRFLIKNILRSD